MRLMICFGTRPEAIKMASLVSLLKDREDVTLRVCVTAQHRQMLDQVLELFEITPDHDLDLMSPNQTLAKLTHNVLAGVTEVLRADRPDMVVVQGDTTTTFAVALAAFYERIPVAHLEAGLRTYKRYSPFPEEINRRLTSELARWHFAPTERARAALLREGIPDDSVFVVGNTVIDALLTVVEKARVNGLPSHRELEERLRGNRFLLVTGHRRESFGEGFRSICKALARIATKHPDLQIVYPVHLNPNVQEPVHAILGGVENVHLIEPLNYLEFVWLMDSCSLILTDSGGIQEEAPSLGKPVLVMRETTERLEAIEAGVAKLVGSDEDLILEQANRLIEDEDAYREMSSIRNPYGDGTSARRIFDILADLRASGSLFDEVAH